MTAQREDKNEPLSVGHALPVEQARVRGLIAEYRAIGPAGMIGATLMEAALQRADEAAISGDVLAILRSYEELKGITG